MAGKSKKRKATSSDVSANENKRQKNEETKECQNERKEICKTEIEFQPIVKKVLNVDLPGDFYEFWEFCLEMCPESPIDALADILGLQLTGPYNIVNGELKQLESSDDCLLMHMHSRFFYDSPEFMTIIKEKNYKTGFHIGYFRDVPNKLPSILASNEAEVSHEFKTCGDNVFFAIRCYAEELLKQTKNKSRKEKIKELISKIDSKAKESNQNMKVQSALIKERTKQVVTKTFNKIGIVVPVDKNEVGYRPLNLSDVALKNLLSKICESESKESRDKYFDELHDLVTLVQFANDECDYGMGLELGIDLFCYGNDTFNSMVLSLLPMAYSLLNRNLFGDIVKKHLTYRKKEGPIDLTDEKDRQMLKS